MLSKAQEKLIKSLHSKKGRIKSGLCLLEGEKFLQPAKKYLKFTFTEKDSHAFNKLVTTQTPQKIAAVAEQPIWRIAQVLQKNLVVILDHVQDPGNLGNILRLAQGFSASLLLHECADPSNPKVLRSAAGAYFQVPQKIVSAAELKELIKQEQRPLFRLEKRPDAQVLNIDLNLPEKIFLIAGSEGQGINLKLAGQSISIPHNKRLESLNVGNSLAIFMYLFSQNT